MRALWSDYYGATLPLKWAKSIQEGAPALGAFTLGLLTGILVFFLTLVLCTFCLFLHTNVVACIFVVAATVCTVLILGRERSIWHLPLGCCGLCAIFWGVILGRYCYSAYGFFVLMYANSRTYQNVDPAQRAGSVGDAGRIVFAAEAHVDAGRSVGYTAADGSIYCAAPIIGIGEPRRVEFWAVGTDCCASSGAFRCGAADDPDARGGAVIFSSPSGGPLGMLLKSGSSAVESQYNMARKKAQATLGLYAGKSEDAVLVSWMTNQNLAMLARQYAEQAWVFIAVSSFVYTIASAPLAWLASRMATAKPARNAHW